MESLKHAERQARTDDGTRDTCVNTDCMADRVDHGALPHPRWMPVNTFALDSHNVTDTAPGNCSHGGVRMYREGIIRRMQCARAANCNDAPDIVVLLCNNQSPAKQVGSRCSSGLGIR